MGIQNPLWKVDPETGCHIWQGARDHNGYARVKHDGRNCYVHRLRYEHEVGPIAPRTRLAFTCKMGKEGCCNPQHLEPVVSASARLLEGKPAAAHLLEERP